MKDLVDEGRMSFKEHAVRMEAARAVAQWELGSGSWANQIVGAYMEPDSRVVTEAKAGIAR